MREEGPTLLEKYFINIERGDAVVEGSQSAPHINSEDHLRSAARGPSSPSRTTTPTKVTMTFA